METPRGFEIENPMPKRQVGQNRPKYAHSKGLQTI